MSNATYVDDPGSNLNIGYCDSHYWQPSFAKPGYWWVDGIASFTTCGYAVVDDFGTLVQVQLPDRSR